MAMVLQERCRRQRLVGDVVVLEPWREVVGEVQERQPWILEPLVQQAPAGHSTPFFGFNPREDQGGELVQETYRSALWPCRKCAVMLVPER